MRVTREAHVQERDSVKFVQANKKRRGIERGKQIEERRKQIEERTGSIKDKGETSRVRLSKQALYDCLFLLENQLSSAVLLRTI